MSGNEWAAALKASPLIMEPSPAASFRQKDEMIAKLNHEVISLRAKLGTLQGAHDRLIADFNALMAKAAQTPIVPQPVADVFPVNALNWSVPGYGINLRRRS